MTIKLLNILFKLETCFKKNLKDCHVPAVGKMNGCLTTAYLATLYLGTRWWEKLKSYEFENLQMKCSKFTNTYKNNLN
ncbi:hypothetical protein D0809_24330 [Flavobacterium circumlabens]|uniref:Uncharacterized protein n=1 Tax=Flavobacterium circumlabens TaxID=2133765 RepID=A0A4Y7U784_9FLAO|nr:hypothetical protein EV142_1323 [Flavobacterium circumlabens]TEB41669.1 hypothetical protein D0809_24330 [Flavobacterium circumlabens]